MEEWKNDCRLLRLLAVGEAAAGAPRPFRIRRLAMDVHDAPPRRNARVEHLLQQRLLIDPRADPDRVALPVGAGPPRLARDNDAVDRLQPLLVAGGELAPA